MSIERKIKIWGYRENKFSIPQICKIMGLGKGTVGYYLKGFLKIPKPKLDKIKPPRKIKEINKFKILDKIGVSKESFILESRIEPNKKKLGLKLGVSDSTIKKLQTLLNCENIENNHPGRRGWDDYWDILKGNKIVNNRYQKGKYIKGITGRLKRFILKENILEYKCSICGLDKWRDKPLTLELDHIDGDRKNNLLVNLRIICPNCHSQTKTWKGNNKNKIGAVVQ
jgi:5-methylcytosine-specific restriction endonuclease McrA